MKTLVVVAHPNMKDSVVNKRWVEELEKNLGEFTIHKLYDVYPDEQIDVKREQALVEAHSNLVLQFPLYWFSCPPLMKKWLDEVLVHGWSYGVKEHKFVNRKVALAVSAGIAEEDFSAKGRYLYTLEQALLPFEMTVNYTDAIYKGFTAFYGAENKQTATQIESGTVEYINFLKSI